ncbi:MAG: hypothetical protein ACOYNN_08710 [Terrimicrobiaceae bacterium]
MTSYTISIPYNEFREWLLESDERGPWGDRCFHETFDKYVEDDLIRIEYKYGDAWNGKTTIKWRIADVENSKVYLTRYGGSSHFAMWWCGLTDKEEDGFEDCVCGYTHHLEDKCPNEATAHHFEKWQKHDEEEDNEEVEKKINLTQGA